MKRIRYIAIYGVLIIGLMGCKKEVVVSNSSYSNVLPPLTHEGKNTFGCKVNGEVWVAYAPYSISGPIALEGNYDPSTGNFLLEGTLENSSLNRLETIGIGSHNVFNPGFYNVPAEGNDYIAGFLDYKENYNCSRYYYRSVLRNEINITFLSLNKRIISGTFEMDLVNPSCPGDTIRIREGRFDWRY